ncbi:hypothetical protein BU23DRAFT_556517 [Bimuria novae-zelandiae CBS 107.79]|uniref:Uncharacterized protein n=1 Tax=Bimuria novae-zelandiae CBS 107.79 TaxID=1447943 RepID=A0A6A5V3H7_9PLEO|nr:hypothetical protein BU23DRAFT_556517 [Bimuria novae-zelandiae CBS 107.79]
MTSYASSTTARSSMDDMKSGVAASNISVTPSSTSSSTKSPSKTRKAWEFIKRHAKEHHESVNAAYATYYGQGQMSRRAPLAEK